jgi:hypothetical protein
MSTSQYSARRYLGRYGGAVASARSFSACPQCRSGADDSAISPAAQQWWADRRSVARQSSAGDVLTGDYNVSGTAWESASVGAGVSRVDVFLAVAMRAVCSLALPCQATTPHRCLVASSQ